MEMGKGRCLIREEVALAYMSPKCLGSLGDGGRTVGADVGVGGEEGKVCRVLAECNVSSTVLIYQDTVHCFSIFHGTILFMFILI